MLVATVQTESPSLTGIDTPLCGYAVVEVTLCAGRAVTSDRCRPHLAESVKCRCKPDVTLNTPKSWRNAD
jgi:hypothetical protein